MTARLLIIPGLHDGGPAHWQTWLQGFDRHAVRVEQRDWATPDLDRWTARIASVLERAGPGPWIAGGVVRGLSRRRIGHHRARCSS